MGDTKLKFWDDCGARYFGAYCVLPYGHEGMHFDPEDGLEDAGVSWNFSWNGRKSVAKRVE